MIMRDVRGNLRCFIAGASVVTEAGKVPPLPCRRYASMVLDRRCFFVCFTGNTLVSKFASFFSMERSHLSFQRMTSRTQSIKMSTPDRPVLSVDICSRSLLLEVAKSSLSSNRQVNSRFTSIQARGDEETDMEGGRPPTIVHLHVMRPSFSSATHFKSAAKYSNSIKSSQ